MVAPCCEQLQSATRHPPSSATFVLLRGQPAPMRVQVTLTPSNDRLVVSPQRMVRPGAQASAYWMRARYVPVTRVTRAAAPGFKFSTARASRGMTSPCRLPVVGSRSASPALESIFGLPSWRETMSSTIVLTPVPVTAGPPLGDPKKLRLQNRATSAAQRQRTCTKAAPATTRPISYCLDSTKGTTCES